MTAQARTVTNAPEALRDFAEKSAAQAKENLQTMTAAAEETTDVLKHGYATTVTGIQHYNTKILEFTNANIKGAAEHATKLMSVKSPMEFFALKFGRMMQSKTRRACSRVKACHVGRKV